MSEVIIRPFARSDGAAFDALNRRWIEKYFALEAKDIEQIEHPQATIIDKGGQILVAETGGRAMGCVALIKGGEGAYELAKMAVDPDAQRRGIGRLLIEAAVAWVREQSATRLWLETNDILENALALYRKTGFRDAEWDYDSPYTRCNIVMDYPL
ncbi:MAG: GNAT family N-acetyltransferase [Sphingomonadaceae bacterium]|nr:GNAT family N-acetyltransferase [Sphingomonadaceae bacterium]